MGILKKLNTDILLNENIFLMKFIMISYHLLKALWEKQHTTYQLNKLINKIIVNQPSAFIWKIERDIKFSIDEFQDIYSSMAKFITTNVDSVDYNKS